jgi:hypothetical protein
VFAAAGTIPASASAAGRNDARSSVSGAGTPANATGGVPADQTRGTPSSQAKTVATSKLKTVEYDGYSVTVPSSWPVFHLDTDPGQCVRYDINAVYLGNPGADQNCPSNLIGRVQTITITDAGVSPTPRALYQRAAVAHGGLGAALPASGAGQRVGSVPSTLTRLDQYSQEHEFQAAVSHSNVSVMGTYGSDPGQVETIIRGVHKAAQPSGAGTPAGTPGSARGSAPTTGAGQARQAAAITDTPDRTLPIKATSTPASAPTSTPQATPKPTATPTPTGTPTPSPTSSLASTLKPRIPSPPVNGFDTCTAPSVSAMKAWKSKYSAIGVYIGGQNMACSFGNLSSSWIKSVHSMGWSLLPLYVGLQAPCNPFPGKISGTWAAVQAKGAADAAVSNAANFGLGKGTPIYFDMESYNNSNASCRTAVLTFLDAWTRELHARGYVSGVYSSASTGVTDLVGITTISGHTMAQPDAMWFALWDRNGNLTGTPYLPSSRWASDRVKQYAGNKTQKIGGYTINIDADRVGGAVAGP